METVSADRQRILVVEDLPDNLLVMQATLEHEGYEVLAVSNGEEALRYLAESGTEVDLILSDVMMPNISGYELCQEIRRNPRTAHLPVVLITAKRLGERDAIYGMDKGADEYLTRPIDPRLLVKKIQLLLSRKRHLEHWQDKYRQEKQQLELQEWERRTLVHDMCNPLTGAMAALTLLELDPEATPRQADLIKKVRTCLNRQHEMLQDILCTAAAQNGHLTLNRQTIDLSCCIREQVELYRETAQSKKMEIRCHGVELPHPVNGDARLLNRVIANLLMNALKHGRSASTITIWLGKPQSCPWPVTAIGKTVVAVHNEGSAIAAPYHKSIFLPFAQAPATPEGGGMARSGVGLGLNFCLKIVELHGGNIDLLSPVPGSESGNLFYFSLP